MGLTRVQSNTGSSYIQPNIGEVVDVVMDPMINWINAGAKIHIDGGGIYKVISKIAFAYQLQLLSPVALSGQLVSIGLVYPIEEQSSSTFWGDNGKEW